MRDRTRNCCGAATNELPHLHIQFYNWSSPQRRCWTVGTSLICWESETRQDINYNIVSLGLPHCPNNNLNLRIKNWDGHSWSRCNGNCLVYVSDLECKQKLCCSLIFYGEKYIIFGTVYHKYCIILGQCIVSTVLFWDSVPYV